MDRDMDLLVFCLACTLFWVLVYGFGIWIWN
jgi:hypothetical protein